MSNVHTSATTGFANGVNYDTFRPTYPPSSVNAFLTGMNLSGHHGATILEIAAGTGKFTELLARREEAFKVIAVEPVAGMREMLEQKLLRVEVREGVADSVPVGDRQVDGVIAAQSFHWFPTKAALMEFARVLKPGGYLGIIWNVEDYNKPATWPAQTPWEEKLNQMMFSLPVDGQDRFRQLAWRSAFSAPVNVSADGKSPLFETDIHEGQSEVWKAVLTPQELFDRIGTLSQMVPLKGKAKERWVEEYWKVLEEAEKDREGKVEVHGRTFFAWARKL